MKPKPKDINTISVELARIIGKTRTYIDIIGTIASFHKTQNSFWDLIIDALYDLVVIDSFKLIDGKNLSIYLLIELIKGIRQSDVDELDSDKAELISLTNANDFLLIRHRNNQKAHIPKTTSANLPRHADLSKIIELLDLCETKLKKYNRWIEGEYYSIDFNSIYAGGHQEILDYITKIVNQK